MIAKLITQIKSKERSVVDITTKYLERIGKVDPKLNSFITLNSKGALKQADELDAELSSSKDIDDLFAKKPLFGIPIAHKDIYSTKGLETTAASKILKGYIPPFDATVVKRYSDAGAVLLGKLNCDAFAHGGSGENSDFGPTKNPYDVSRVPGGSSSGSAVSVAAGLAAVGSGTDTGGSLRSPASFTNTVAIKPTYSRVPRYGIISMASSTDTIGHVTNTVEDSARALSVTAGFDPHDATSSKAPVPDYLEGLKKGVKGLKIGIPKEYMSDSVDLQIRNTVEAVAKKYEALGAEIVDISLPHTKYALAVYYLVQPSEVSSNLGQLLSLRS